MSVVRSGEMKPFSIARPASSASEAIIRSTSPGPGVSAKTGTRANRSQGSGKIST